MTQEPYRVRFEQGLAGGRSIASGDVLVVVVDVLSFTTCVSVALDRGIEVVPARWRDGRAPAVAAACRAHLERGRDAVVAVVAAGERWPDDSLRPAWEDVWGAGAILAALGREADASPEALAAADAHRAASVRGLPLADLVSGRELVDQGFAEDVAIAAEVDSSASVPRARDGLFTD